jgi:hypothetical protein
MLYFLVSAVSWPFAVNYHVIKIRRPDFGPAGWVYSRFVVGHVVRPRQQR